MRGEEAVEGGDSILVKEREVCSVLGLLSREMAGLSEDMAWLLLQRALGKAQMAGVVVMMRAVQ